MFIPGLLVFSTYVSLVLADELLFHRKRRVSPAERAGHLFDHALLAGAVGVILLVESSPETRPFFLVPAAISLLTVSRAEFRSSEGWSGGERWLHSFRYLLHPVMLLLAAAIWPFIDGAGLFLGIALPFSTRNLRELCTGYFAALAGICLLHAFAMIAARRKERSTQARPAPAAAPKEESGDTTRAA